jgi:hypothetical protein
MSPGTTLEQGCLPRSYRQNKERKWRSIDGYLCEQAKEVVAVQRIGGDNVTDKRGVIYVSRKELNIQWQVLTSIGSSQEDNSLLTCKAKCRTVGSSRTAGGGPCAWPCK